MWLKYFVIPILLRGWVELNIFIQISTFSFYNCSSTNTFYYWRNYWLLFISSFKINKLNPLPALAALFPLISLSSLFITSEAKLLTNPGKLSLAKGKARSFITFFCLNYVTYYKGSPNEIIIDNWALLSFISVNIFLAMGLLIFVVCFVVRNNLCGNSSSWKIFLVIFNIVPVIFFGAGFNLFSCVFVSLTLVSW